MRDIGWTIPDIDSDGVIDSEDCDPTSDLSPTIVIGDVNTGVPNTLLQDGCTRADVIAQLAASNPRKGDYVAAIDALTDQWLQVGLITGNEKGAIMSAAGRFKP